MANITNVKISDVTYNITDANAVHYTANASVSVAGTTKTTNTLSPSTLFVANGLIMGGTAQSAGLVTRGICGVGTPNATTGACTKDNLYLNYDGDNNYSRKVVLGAGSIGSAITGGAYTYSAVRGDQMVSYVTSAISGKANTSDLSKVATSGSYNDLSDTPIIDSAISSTSTNAVQNKVIYTALSGKQASLTNAQLNACNSGITSSKVTTYDGYASQISGKQDKLTAGSNITISGTTISSSYTDTKNTAGSTNNSSKLFLIGATSQTTNPQTYSNSNVYTSNGILYATNISEGGTYLSNKYLEKSVYVNTPVSDPTDQYQCDVANNGDSFEVKVSYAKESGDIDNPTKQSMLKITPDGIILSGDEVNRNDYYSVTGGLMYRMDGQDDNYKFKVLDSNDLTSVVSSGNTSPITSGGVYNYVGLNFQTTLVAGSNITLENSTISASDTKNTAGSTNSTSKLYLIGATSQATNPQTYSNSNVYTSNGTLFSTYLHPTDGIWFYSSSFRVTNMYMTRVYYSFSSPSAGTDHYKDVSIVGASTGSGKWFAVSSSFGTTSSISIPTTGDGSYATYYTTTATILSSTTIRVWFHMTQTYSGTFIAWADVIAIKYY